MSVREAALQIVIRAREQASNVLARIRSSLLGTDSAAQNARDGVDSLARRIIALGATYLGINTLKNAIGGIINTGAKFEQLETQINTLMGSIEEGDKATAWIKEFAKTTPADLEGVTNGFIKLKAFGIDPMNGSYQAIVDQTSKLGFTQEKMEGVILAVGQAWTKQKLQGEEALQLIERGVPVWDLLAEATGRSAVQLQEMATKGKLGRKEITLLIEQMGKASAGAAQSQMSTWNGMISNLQDSWTNFVGQIADAGVFEFAKTQLKEMLDLASQMAEDGRMAKAAQQISDYLVTTATRVKGYITDVVADFDALVLGAEKVVAGFNIVFNSFTAGVKAIGADVSQSLGEILEALANGLEAANLDDAAKSLREKSGAMQAVSKAFKEALAEDAEDIKKAWDKLNGQSFEGAKNAANSLATETEKAKSKIVSSFSEITSEANATSEELRNAFVNGINAAETTEEVAQLVEQFKALKREGRISTDDLVTGLLRVDGALENIAKQADSATKAMNGISVSTAGISSYLDALDEAREAQQKKTASIKADTDAAKENTAANVESANSSAYASEKATSAIGYTYKLAGLARDQWQSLSSAMGQAFDNFVQYTQDYQKSLSERGIATASAWIDRMSRAYSSVAQKAERLQAQYEKQDTAATRWINRLSDTTLATAEMADQAEEAISRYNLLGDEKLSALRSAIAAVKAETESLNSSLSSTLNNLRNELDSLNDDQLAIETRAYQNQLTGLQEQLERAQELGSTEAIKSAREAIQLLKETYRIKKQNIQDEASSSTRDSTDTTSSTTTSRTVNISIGGTTRSVAVADAASEASLLAALESVGEVTL